LENSLCFRGCLEFLASGLLLWFLGFDNMVVATSWCFESQGYLIGFGLSTFPTPFLTGSLCELICIEPLDIGFIFLSALNPILL
jgi:hypothetical protein